MKEPEVFKQIAGQFGLYTISSIIATLVNFGIQIPLRVLFIYDGLQWYDDIIIPGIALAFGYTAKYFLDCINRDLVEV